MRISDGESSEPTKPAPNRERFQQAVQQAGERKAPATHLGAPRQPAGARPPGSAMGLGKPAAPVQRLQVAASPGKVIAHARVALASPENLGRVRQHMHVEAQRLQHTRHEAQALSQERTEHRVSELIARELARDLRAAEPPPAIAAPRLTPQPTSEPARDPASGDSVSQAGGPRVGGASTGAQSPEAPDTSLKAQAAMELIERIEVFVKSQRPAMRLSLGGALEATVEVERTGPREVALRIQGKRGPVAMEELSRIRDALEAKGLRLRTLQAV